MIRAILKRVKMLIDRFEAWHRSWKSYKAPRVIRLHLIGEGKVRDKWQDPEPEYLQDEKA